MVEHVFPTCGDEPETLTIALSTACSPRVWDEPYCFTHIGVMYECSPRVWG